MFKKDIQPQQLPQIEDVLKRAVICHLSFSVKNQPYIVPVNFGYEDWTLYIHSAPRGRKLELIAQNPQIAFAAQTSLEVLRNADACKFDMHFQSVLGFGWARLLQDPAEKRHGLEVISAHFEALPGDTSQAMLEKLAIIKIDIEEMTYKEHL